MNDRECLQYSQKIIDKLPYYICEYYNSKIDNPLSQTLLYDYLMEYQSFFQWLMDYGVICRGSLKDITVEDLERVPQKQFDNFILAKQAISSKKGESRVRQVTIIRKAAALKSLYNFLDKEELNGKKEYIL